MDGAAVEGEGGWRRLTLTAAVAAARPDGGVELATTATHIWVRGNDSDDEAGALIVFDWWGRENQ